MINEKVTNQNTSEQIKRQDNENQLSQQNPSKENTQNQNNPNTTKTRIKKLNPKLKSMDEEAQHQLKLSKLSILEEDEDIQKEE
jgi:hypothetical protein